MPDLKISELPEDTSPSLENLYVEVANPSGVPINKKVILGNLISGKIKKLASDPSVPAEGEIWYNTTDHHYKGYNGTEVVLVG